MNNQELDPWLVKIGNQNTSGYQEPIEMHVDVGMVLHELQQAGIELTQDGLPTFVSAEVRSDLRALEAYLTILRHTISRPPPRLRRAFLGLYLKTHQSWTPPRPQWVWSKIESIATSQGSLVIRGTCGRLAEAAS